jgi:putative endonuclease
MMPRGNQAEQIAAKFLQRNGLELLQRNYRCRHGEIDLVMRDGDTLVFIEVRLRSSDQFGGAAGSIDAAKRKRITLAARHYLAAQPFLPPCRFDAVLMSALDEQSLEWRKNAFVP